MPNAAALAREVDLLLVFGGDGTMLHAARQIAGSKTPMLGVNIGSLGFLTAVPSDKLAEALKLVWAGEFKFESRALIEATGKKARFVTQTAERIGCRNVEVVHARAESYRPFELFDIVMARALASLADFVAYAGHLCAPGGRLLAMKGRRPDDEISALPKAFRVLAVHRLKLPGLDDERHLVELSPGSR